MFGLFSALPEDASDSEYIVWLYDTYHRLMFATAGHYLSNPADQEDAVQDSLCALVKNAKTVRALNKRVLPSYLVSTVKNTAITILRGQKGQPLSLDDEAIGDANTPAAPEDSFRYLGHKEQIAALWKSLSPADRFLLEGKYILGYSDAQLASRLNCKEESIRMKLTRVRRRALQIIQEQEGSPYG